MCIYYNMYTCQGPGTEGRGLQLGGRADLQEADAPYYTIGYYTIYYILCTVCYILYTIYYILYAIHYTLYIIYYILYTIYYIFRKRWGLRRGATSQEAGYCVSVHMYVCNGMGWDGMEWNVRCALR